MFTPGQLLRDYQTTQVPDSVGELCYRTRPDELVSGKKRLGTILSSREYRSDALALVALKSLENAPCPLVEIKTHLQQPKYHLYLGRKSCPLAAPLHPQIVNDQHCYFGAFKTYQQRPMLPTSKEANGELAERDFYWLGSPKHRHYYWEGKPEYFSDTSDLSRRQTRVRHDQPLSRKRWQFAPRQEHYLYVERGE